MEYRVVNADTLDEADTEAEDETEEICTAILYHKRANSHTDAKMLEKLLQKADKYSRKCFSCDAIDSCYWPEQMKNKTVIL